MRELAARQIEKRIWKSGPDCVTVTL